ncbi:MAG: hypothetical protein ACFFE8_04895 [Candidatus Heimdallarchaeota archaeon]
MEQRWIIEPRSERAGLFSQEDSLRKAIKDVAHPDLSMKRSTRGFTLLLKNNPANPMLAGKNRVQVERLLHLTHCHYVKHLANRVLQGLNLPLEDISDLERSFEITFGDGLSELKIIVDKTKWFVTMKALGITENSDFKQLTILASRIGKISS